MKYIIIDDNRNFAKKLCEQLNRVYKANSNTANICNEADIIIKQDDKLDELSKNIAGMNLPDDVVLFINANLQTGENTRKLYKGIELLKWLRLENCFNHCVIYSFVPVSRTIKLNPLNAILLSKGVSFIELPNSFSGIVTDEKVDKANLLPFFRAEIDLPKIRHELANIWGAERMNWLLGIATSTKPNYLIAILKFITPIENLVEIDKKELEELISNFNANGKTIIYYDDMKDHWLPGLKRLFGKNNIVGYDPKQISPQLFLDNFIKRDKSVGCVLLDLRLENEKETKNVLEYSGGKLLLELKKNRISLPVIMFTASNKAESVRKLLEAGADYVWTKEGVDNGINNEYTLSNALILLKEVGKSLSKYANDNYEKIYEADFALGGVNTEGKDDVIYANLLNNETLKEVKNIYIDTNYLINSIEDKYIDFFYKFILTNQYLENKKEIIIHDDVVREIFIISQQDEKKTGNEKNNPYRVPVCRFLLNKIFQWKQARLIEIDWKHGGQSKTISKVQQHIIPQFPANDIVSSLDCIKEKRNFFQKIMDSFSSKVEERNDILEEVQKQIAEFSEKSRSNPDLSKLRLNADYTFAKIIPLALENGSIAFITNDKECAKNVDIAVNNKNHEYIYTHFENKKFNESLIKKL